MGRQTVLKTNAPIVQRVRTPDIGPPPPPPPPPTPPPPPPPPPFPTHPPDLCGARVSRRRGQVFWALGLRRSSDSDFP